MLGLLLHEAEGCNIPERGGTADAEDNLVALGRAEELAEALADRAHEVLDGGLPVGRAQNGFRRRRERIDLFLPDLGWPGSEPSVPGQEVGGNSDAGFAHGCSNVGGEVALAGRADNAARQSAVTAIQAFPILPEQA